MTSLHVDRLGGVCVYDRLGRTIRRSRNLRGLLTHYRKSPDDLVVKVVEHPDYSDYDVTLFWPHTGDTAKCRWVDWRVLLDWLMSRRSWSIARITFDAPLYDKIAHEPRIAETRKHGIPVTRHAYLNP